MQPAYPEAFVFPTLTDSIRSMRVALAVARHGSTVRAGEAIHLSQSAVARSILDLERACGVPLFDRTTKGLVPTDIGARLTARIDTLVGHLSAGSEEAVLATLPAARGTNGNVDDRFSAVVSGSQLKALIAISQAGNEAAAGAMLGVSQPAVHHALQSLETLLGIRLFYRLSFGTKFTPAGEALLRRAKLCVAEIKAMEAELASSKGAVQGHIVIGVLPLSAPIFLPLAVQALVTAHPEVEVHIIDGTYESLVQQLMHAEVDVIVGALRPADAGRELRHVHLFDDDLVIVARSGHPCFGRRTKTLKDLAGWDWIAPSRDSPADRTLDRIYREAGLQSPTKILRAGSQVMTLALVKQTDRLALASFGQTLADSHGGDLRMVPVDLPSTKRPIGLAMRAIGVPGPELSLLVEACDKATSQGR